MAIPVYLEVGQKRVFACTIDWPGWCRSGKGEQAALEALAGYRDRYAVVTAAAGAKLPAADFDVVERVPGNMTTDFGAPGVIPNADRTTLTSEHIEQLITLLRACWTVLDRVAAGAPQELRKGPRGGGRDRDKMVDHVLDAEAGYSRAFGTRHKAPAHDDREGIAAFRVEIVAGLRSPGEKRWPVRYAVRRIAWHAIDHAWEMEDRSF